MAGVRFPKSLTPRLASRGDGASDRRWYHGTSHEFSPGDLVTAGHPSNYEGGPQEPPGSWTDDHTYFTSEFDGAQRHARNSAFVKGGEAHVYQVEPTGPYEPTPADKDSYPRPAYNYWSEHPLRVVRRVSPGEAESQRTASRWQPSAGIFGPTTGLDPLLFGEDGTLRPQVRHDIMTRLDQCLRVDSGLAGSDWQEWLHVYIAGGSASEWAGSRPNETAQDLDVITAIDLPRAQGHSAFEGMNGGEAASALNAAFWKHFNAEGWKPESGGTWNLTAFCNQRAQDGIAAIRPYAAWDLTDMRWAVKPPHLPEHSLANFDPAVIAHARAVAAEARAVLRMPEPLRTREARDLWEHVHAHRCVAFSGEGTGWDDPGNVDEKYLAYAPHGLLGKIRDLAMAGQWRTAAIRQPEPEEFAHEVYKGDTTDLRLHGDKYILHRAGPRHINAYARGRELVQPDSPNYTKGHAQPRPVGYLSWTHHPDGKPPEIYKTMVKEKHRRKGVASAMLEFAREIEPNLQHSIMLSEDARKWVKGTEAKTGKTAASHHDTSGSDHSGVYLRFGDWPHDERSFSPAGGYHEDGVSAYDLDREGDPAIGDGLDRWHDHDEHCEPDCDLDLDNADNDPHEEMRGRVRKAERNRDYGNDKPSEAGHLVRGEMAGIGYDGEPLLKNVRRVGDWIDHRHLFIDTAGPHRLARDPSGPDYEEPEEEPPYGYRNRTAAAITSTAAAASDAHGMREKWSPGDRPHFEYHCEESHDSADAPLWYRSHQQARVLGREQDEDYPGAMEDRLEAGMPHVYRVRFDDGHEGSATEDELLTHPRYFQRPDPPQPPRTAAGKRGGETEWSRHDFGEVMPHMPAKYVHVNKESRTAALDYEDDYEGDYEDDYKGNPDRYVTCGQGHEHWGALGAAGLLVRHRDGGSGPYRYLLQKRSPYVQHGRTWSTPGGALQHGESPEEGAVREAREEGMHLPPGLSHHHTFTDDHGGWAYHTVVMDSPHRFNPEGEGESDWESEGHRWVTPQEAQKLPLHPGFSASWEKVRKSGAVQKTAAPGYLRNPYHGSPEFGGRDDWSHTWFHGTKGTPDFGTRRKFSDEAQRAELPPEQRKMNSGWTQPNQHLGIHFSPLHEVAHKFVGSVSSSPGALVHARLRFSNPAVFPSEEHLNIAMADWGSKHYLHWHDDKLNGQMGWSYGDQEGTRRDYSQVPDNPRERWHLSQKAQSILQWHPHMPEILNGFRRHLADQGHHGIVYGNSLEGPYETDAGRGGDASVKYIRKRENWPAGHPYSFSAIADPGDIEVTHVEHISPWRAEPEAHQRTWEDASDQDEPDEMRDRVLGWHREHGGKLPPKLAAAPQGRDEQLAGMDPHTRATALAQEQVRYHHPRLTTPLGIRSGQTSEVLSSWLREHGHPRADEAYVAEHPSPGGMQSNTGRGPDGEPAVILHPDRWDYGTLAHEAAHLVTDHQTGRQFGAPHGPEGAHGPEWAKNYANLLGRISKPAAGHFMSLYRQHAPAPERRPDPRFTPRREDAPAPGMAYLSVPHGTLHALPPEMQSRQDGGRHHVTVAHLPRGMNDDEYEEVLRHARKAAAASPPLEGTLGGMETFPHGAGPESRRVAYVPASIPGVERLHGDLGGVNASPHPEFRPHVTVSYLRKGQDNPPPHPQVPVRFTHLHVERDGQVTSIPLTGTQRMEREAAASGPWYHGSPYRIDSSEMIEPGHDPVNADDGPLPHVYFSGSPHDAARWAEEGSRYVNEEDSPGWRTYPHVYEVRPTGHHEEDPQGEFEGDRRSLHPLQVIRERHDLGLSHDSGCPGCSAARSTRHEAVSGYDGLTDRSGMIYLDLPPGAVRPVPGGTDDHHITVVYLGKDVSDEAFAEACRRTRGAAARLAPMDGVLRGIDIFPPSASSDGKVPAFVPAYIGGIGALRRELEDLSASEHRDYRPHVTLAFMQEGDSLPAPHPAVPLHFDRVHVKRGGEVRSFPLGQTTETGRQAVAAQERPTFYHGSGKRYPDGHVIDPAEPHKKLYPQSDPGKAYFSDNLWNARNWADTASPGGKGHVYEVEPAGPYEEDPHYAGPEENGIYDLSVSPIRRINVYQTGHPLRIVRRVPPSE